MTIEERLQRLEDIEYLRTLQARYQRCVDTRAWDELLDCFVPDAVSSYGDGSMAYEGRDNIVNFLKSQLKTFITSTHMIHGSEIDWKDPEHAHARWYFEDYLLHGRFMAKCHGAAIYHVDYQKCPDGQWRIKSIGYERIYHYYELRGLVNLLSTVKGKWAKR